MLAGVEIRLNQVMTKDNKVTGVLSLSNTGVGHRFPTYLTPRVVLEAYQRDARGELIAGTRRESVIARQVSMNLSTLENGSNLKGAATLRRALRNAEASVYTLFQQEIPF